MNLKSFSMFLRYPKISTLFILNNSLFYIVYLQFITNICVNIEYNEAFQNCLNIAKFFTQMNLSKLLLLTTNNVVLCTAMLMDRYIRVYYPGNRRSSNTLLD